MGPTKSTERLTRCQIMLINHVKDNSFGRRSSFDTVAAFVFHMVVHSHPQAQYDGEDTKGKVETKTDVPSWFLACGKDKRGDNACVLAKCIEHSERDRSLTLRTRIVCCTKLAWLTPCATIV
jgi:hypothetical protein